MIEASVTTFLGLVLGLVTGFYFERRATLSAQAQTEDLRRQLREMRESIYSVGGTVPAEQAQHAIPTPSAAEEIYRWVSQVQDPSGKVPRERVTARFRGSGMRREEIDAALSVLISEGRLRLDDANLEVS